MTEIERAARLLCEARYRAGNQKMGRAIDAAEMQRYVDLSWDDVRFTTRAEDMAAAGLTLAPLEPSEEVVDAMAVAILARVPEGYGMTPNEAADYARAAYRAFVQREG